MKYVHGILALIILLSTSCQSVEKPSSKSEAKDYSQAIDSARVLVRLMMEESQVPGMAAAVSVDGKLVWSEGFGFSDLENQVAVDPGETMFRIGSVSKTFTSSAMGKLMDAGKLNPDELIQTYVSYFPE